MKLPDGTELPDDPLLKKDSALLWKFFDIHHGQPNISSRAYRAQLRLALGKTVAQKIRIYLDTRYWIHLIDFRLGRPEKPEHERIYQLLQKLVSKGFVLCPASFSAFDELLKNKDPKVRSVSAEVMDELSGQVCLQNPLELMKIELTVFLRKFTPDYPWSIPILECVWTKAGYWLGEPVPTNPTYPPDFETAFQKAFDDVMMQRPFSEIVEDFFNSPSFTPSEDSIKKLNEEFAKFSATAKSREQLYKAQLSALLLEHGGLIDDVLQQLLQRLAWQNSCAMCQHY
ncbi:MAG: hypothetical protein ACREFE_09365 [Limisphaerales bacterium]